MTVEFTATTTTARTGPVLTIKGELDVATAPVVRAEIATLVVAAGQLLVVDLAGVGYCDSSGIAALVAARNVTQAAQAGIALVAVPGQVARILGMVGLAGLFPAHPDLDHATAGWARE